MLPLPCGCLLPLLCGCLACDMPGLFDDGADESLESDAYFILREAMGNESAVKADIISSAFDQGLLTTESSDRISCVLG